MTRQNPTRGRRRGGTMLQIEGLDETATARLLAPLDLSGAGGAHDEAWLQRLIHQFPQALPVNDLEPGFSRLVSICRELPVRTGYIDNLFATADGDLVLVECKLWRNPQARREVVAQIIDYAHCLAGWSYEDLDQAVRQARTAGEGDEAGLYALVEGDDALEEAAFVDAVSRTLRLGRFLLIVLGDGIHESAETLAGYLQEHAGFHFTLGLVEAQVHALHSGGYVIQPRVLARTVNIERGIVRVEDGRPVVVPLPAATNVVSGRATSISEERQLEALAAVDPLLPDRLRQFVEHLSDLGVSLEPASRSLVLRWSDDLGNRLNLGAIGTTSDVVTEYANWEPDSIGRVDLAHAYQARLAELVGGYVRQTPKPAAWYVATRGTSRPTLGTLLDQAEGWAAAVRSLVDGYRAAKAKAEAES